MTGYRECFDHAVRAASAGDTVLTVNTRSARAVRAAAEQRLQASWAAWLTPVVLPFGAFVEQLWQDAVVQGAITLHALQREQELQLWRQIIARSSSGRQMLLPESAAALASSSFRTASEYGIALDSPQMSASSDTRAFSIWAAEFRRQLVANNWSCPALFMRELVSCLGQLQLPAKLYVYLPEITPQRRTFLDALTAAGTVVTLSPGHSEDSDASPVRYEFDSVTGELRSAAQWARTQMETAPGSRVGVVLFDLNRKLPQVEDAFRSVLHPEHYFGTRTPAVYEIASPIPLSEYPAIRCALQVLSLFAGPTPFSTLHSLLTSPYLDLDAEAASRFVAQVRPHARLQVGYSDLLRWLAESRELPLLRAALSSLPRHSAFSSVQPVPYWVDISRAILKAFGWPGGVGLNSEEYQCTERWRELLLSASSLELLGWRTDFLGFTQRLEHMAAAQGFKPESRSAPIQVMDAEEAEGSVFDALWIGSCTDESWPDAPRNFPLIPVTLLKAAAVPLVGTAEADARILRTTSRLLHSAPQVALSMALRTEDEREQRWSPCFAAFGIAPFAMERPAPVAESFEALELEPSLDESAPPLAAGEAARGGTSLLQEQSNCPFRAFATRRLGARQQQGPNEAIAPTERGNVMERALQLVWEELKDSDGLCRPDLRPLAEQATDTAIEELLPADADPWMLRFRALERARTIEVLMEWLALESRRAPFSVVDHQLDVEVELAGLHLRGRLDRLDKVGDEHMVIDYKTGVGLSVSAWQVPRPRLPQIPFYALAMQRKDKAVGGVAFGVVRKGECAFKGYTQEKGVFPGVSSSRAFGGTEFSEYAWLWGEELERIAASFALGEAAVDPKVPPGRTGSSCEHCHLTSLCRISEHAAGGIEDEAEGESDE